MYERNSIAVQNHEKFRLFNASVRQSGKYVQCRLIEIQKMPKQSTLTVKIRRVKLHRGFHSVNIRIMYLQKKQYIQIQIFFTFSGHDRILNANITEMLRISVAVSAMTHIKLLI